MPEGIRGAAGFADLLKQFEQTGMANQGTPLYSGVQQQAQQQGGVNNPFSGNEYFTSDLIRDYGGAADHLKGGALDRFNEVHYPGMPAPGGTGIGGKILDAMEGFNPQDTVGRAVKFLQGLGKRSKFEGAMGDFPGMGGSSNIG